MRVDVVDVEEEHLVGVQIRDPPQALRAELLAAGVPAGETVVVELEALLEAEPIDHPRIADERRRPVARVTQHLGERDELVAQDVDLAERAVVQIDAAAQLRMTRQTVLGRVERREERRNRGLRPR